jgi:hypothetical protein
MLAIKSSFKHQADRTILPPSHSRHTAPTHLCCRRPIATRIPEHSVYCMRRGSSFNSAHQSTLSTTHTPMPLRRPLRREPRHNSRYPQTNRNLVVKYFFQHDKKCSPFCSHLLRQRLKTSKLHLNPVPVCGCTRKHREALSFHSITCSAFLDFNSTQSARQAAASKHSLSCRCRPAPALQQRASRRRCPPPRQHLPLPLIARCALCAALSAAIKHCATKHFLKARAILQRKVTITRCTRLRH